MENKKFLDYYNNKLLSDFYFNLFCNCYCFILFYENKNTLGIKICVAVSIISAVVILFLLLSRSDRN